VCSYVTGPALKSVQRPYRCRSSCDELRTVLSDYQPLSLLSLLLLDVTNLHNCYLHCLYTSQDASSNTQRKKTVRDLEEKLTKTDKKAEDYESRYNLAVRTINQLKNGIQSIFTRIGATTASVDEMLGNQVNACVRVAVLAVVASLVRECPALL
jgi:hypothetical protein